MGISTIEIPMFTTSFLMNHKNIVGIFVNKNLLIFSKYNLFLIIMNHKCHYLFEIQVIT